MGIYINIVNKSADCGFESHGKLLVLSNGDFNQQIGQGVGTATGKALRNEEDVISLVHSKN